MKNKEYCFCIEDSELDSFLSFCEVNNITFSNGNRFPLGETTFVLKNNEVTAVVLSDDDDYDDWEYFSEKYYSDLFAGLSTKEIVNKLKSDKYYFDGLNFIYGEFSLDSENALGYVGALVGDLLEIIFGSNTPIGHPENSTVKSNSYLDFNPLKRA